ncbi:MAG: hypothetical protein IT454_19105 [Planctomycetes bacterium]|nr:hypothetical protein [Planctomycetota bacterium]
MWSRRCAALTGLVVSACAQLPPEREVLASFTLAGGRGELGAKGWSDYDERPLLSVGCSARPRTAPVGLEFTAQGTHSETKESTDERGVDVFDFRLGAGRDFELTSWLRLVGGLGLRAATAEVETTGTFAPKTESDASFGAYAHVGLYVHVQGTFSLGCDAQWADGGDYEIAGRERDAGMSALLIALRWDV